MLRPLLPSGEGIVLIALLGFCACQTYDPPPDVNLEFPEGGAFLEGQEVEVTFSERIDPDSLELNIFITERDGENGIPKDAESLVKPCNLDECGTHDLTLSKNGKKLTIVFAGELGQPGAPFILQIDEGLADDEGNETGATTEFDIQFRADGEMNSEPVEFDEGVYIFLAQVDDPLPAVLTLISDVKILEDGRFAFAGAEGDEINGDPKNTQNPENLIVDETDQGYTMYGTGFVTLDEDGTRRLETEPVNVILPLGPINVHLNDVRLFADIVKNEDTGKDSFVGSLSFEELVLVNLSTGIETPQPGGSTALVAQFVPEDVIPEGHPELCGDLCGAVVDGECNPPEEFPATDFCEE